MRSVLWLGKKTRGCGPPWPPAICQKWSKTSFNLFGLAQKMNRLRKRIVKTSFLFLMGLSVSAFCQSDISRQTIASNPPFKLVIGFAANPMEELSEDQVFELGTGASVHVWKKNISNRDVIKRSHAGKIYGFDLDIRDSNGNLLNLQPSRTRIVSSDKGMEIVGDKNLLKPDEGYITMISLRDIIDTIDPGVYTIQISGHVSDDPNSEVVKSNIVTVRIAPRKPANR